MALKTFKPTSQRQLVLVDRSHLWKGKPVKPLTEGLTKTEGGTTRAAFRCGIVAAVTSAP